MFNMEKQLKILLKYNTTVDDLRKINGWRSDYNVNYGDNWLCQ